MAAPDLLTVGIYTVAEAAYLVGVSQRKVRGWITGHPRRKAPPIIQNELGWLDDRLAFSFKNLMEMRFITYFEAAGVGFSHMRAIMQEVQRLTNEPHPFATNLVFRTDGKKIVAETFHHATGKILYDLKSKNLEMIAVVYDTLKDDVRYDPRSGYAFMWYPRRRIAPNVIVHPSFSFGRPVLSRSKIPTQTIADAAKVEGDATVVAGIFDISRKEVREALKFETELRKAA
jgi:uncharacterized protein (DUF433 family)